jgi:hypothetical protein
MAKWRNASCEAVGGFIALTPWRAEGPMNRRHGGGGRDDSGDTGTANEREPSWRSTVRSLVMTAITVAMATPAYAQLSPEAALPRPAPARGFPGRGFSLVGAGRAVDPDGFVPRAIARISGWRSACRVMSRVSPRLPQLNASNGKGGHFHFVKNNPMQSRIRPTVAVRWIVRPLHERAAAAHDPRPDPDRQRIENTCRNNCLKGRPGIAAAPYATRRH